MIDFDREGEKMEEKGNKNVENITLGKVPLSERKNWLSIALIWSGVLVCVPALTVGGIVGAGMTIGNTMLSLVLGYACILIFMIPLGISSADLGLPTVMNASRSFGVTGSRVVVSIIIAVSMIGWFAYQANLCGNSFSQIIGGKIPVWVCSLVWGAIMLVTAVYGIELLKYLNVVAVPLLIAGLLYGLYYGLVKLDGVSTLTSYEPSTEMSLVAGMNLTMAGFVTGACTAGDYTRYSKNRGDVVKSCIVGVVPAGIIVLSIGAILAVIAGNADLTVVLSNTNLPVLGLLVLVLATWTTATSSAYAAGIAAVNALKLKDEKRALMTLILGIVGLVLATCGIVNYFMTFLNFLTALTPPVAGVLIAEYFVFCKGVEKNWKPTKGVNYVGLVAWLCGVIGSILLGSFFIASINSIVIAFVAYCILGKIFPIKAEQEVELESIV